MSKRKNKGAQAPHQSNSFENMVAAAVQGRLKDFIIQQISLLAQGLMARQQQGFANSAIRTVALEEIVMEKLGMTKDELANRVALVQDRSEGFEQVETVEQGDRVRVEIRTRTADQTEFAGSSRLLIDNVGSGGTVGPELEKLIIGMKAGETRETKFGKDESLVASVTLNRASRQPKKEEALTEESAPQEAPNASADAG